MSNSKGNDCKNFSVILESDLMASPGEAKKHYLDHIFYSGGGTNVLIEQTFHNL